MVFWQTEGNIDVLGIRLGPKVFHEFTILLIHCHNYGRHYPMKYPSVDLISSTIETDDENMI